MMVGTPLVWLLYELVPFRKVPGFKDYKGSEEDEEFDTGGVRWADVRDP